MRTASGATAVQIAESVNSRRRIVAHVGSAHTEAELGLLVERTRELLERPGQGEFDLGPEPAAPRTTLLGQPGDRALLDLSSVNRLVPDERTVMIACRLTSALVSQVRSPTLHLHLRMVGGPDWQPEPKVSDPIAGT